MILAGDRLMIPNLDLLLPPGGLPQITRREAARVIVSATCLMRWTWAVMSDTMRSMSWPFDSLLPHPGTGSANERSGYVVDHCPVPIYAPAADERDAALFLGPDRDGVPLEVLAVELAESDLLVVHAMRLRRRYLDEYRMVMRWHER
jgi:hypothetical protein